MIGAIEQQVSTDYILPPERISKLEKIVTDSSEPDFSDFSKEEQALLNCARDNAQERYRAIPRITGGGYFRHLDGLVKFLISLKRLDYKVDVLTLYCAYRHDDIEKDKKIQEMLGAVGIINDIIKQYINEGDKIGENYKFSKLYEFIDGGTAYATKKLKFLEDEEQVDFSDLRKDSFSAYVRLKSLRLRRIENKTIDEERNKLVALITKNCKILLEYLENKMDKIMEKISDRRNELYNEIKKEYLGDIKNIDQMHFDPNFGNHAVEIVTRLTRYKEHFGARQSSSFLHEDDKSIDETSRLCAIALRFGDATYNMLDTKVQDIYKDGDGYPHTPRALSSAETFFSVYKVITLLTNFNRFLKKQGMGNKEHADYIGLILELKEYLIDAGGHRLQELKTEAEKSKEFNYETKIWDNVIKKRLVETGYFLRVTAKVTDPQHSPYALFAEYDSGERDKINELLKDPNNVFKIASKFIAECNLFKRNHEHEILGASDKLSATLD